MRIPTISSRLLLWELLSLIIAVSTSASSSPPDSRLTKSKRYPSVDGWTLVHLEGTPGEIGYQHGVLLADEIDDMYHVARLELTHDTGKEWSFFRTMASTMMWPHIEQEYRSELQAIADGVRSKGHRLDLWDIVALNGLLEWEYFTKFYDKSLGDTSRAKASVPEHCSAFVATGSYTADGRVVIAHNNWSSYLEGARWTVVFDIVPASGHRMIMDGLPGFIASDDDFGINAAGIMITETTITGFEGYNTEGIPEFVRARKAMQYASSIDDFARIMTEGNNGGYANDWLVADARTGEIASLELGLKNVTLERTRDGYFVGANFPISAKLAHEETTCDLSDSTSSCNARRIRWRQVIDEHKGKITVELAKRFLADHIDPIERKDDPSERTLCGHVDRSSRGMPTWQPPYGPAGAVQNKVADAALADSMAFLAAAGHACGIEFSASAHLRSHKEFEWQKDLLRDVPSKPWTRVGVVR
ncbi:MAG TPA: C45 family peptidase [Methanomassiliicoccales archaeon]|nr:C45 family peptidase [Methanomassiliicoccales archaeon]